MCMFQMAHNELASLCRLRCEHTRTKKNETNFCIKCRRADFMEQDIKVGDNVTLRDSPASGYVTKILPLEKEKWGFRSQKILVEWQAYSGPFPPREYQRVRDIIKIK